MANNNSSNNNNRGSKNGKNGGVCAGIPPHAGVAAAFSR